MMNEKELQQWENQCIQEYPPECVAACPIHVEARAFIGFIGQGCWDEAWQVLQRSMPFPGILARICDAPCQLRCKRQEAGDAVRIGDLEWFCMQKPAPVWRIQTFLSKSKQVAVIGSGLSSLTAALDLSRKGYPVTIFEPQDCLGNSLIRSTSPDLTSEIIRNETDVLTQLGVQAVLQSKVDQHDFLERCLLSFDAVYLGLDATSGNPWELEQNPDGGILVIPRVQTTGRGGVFAGGQSTSPVWKAAEGRWAATTIDRYLQGISLTAGRENEGPQTTRLFVSLEHVTFEHQVPMSNASQGYTETEALAEAKRCLQCECLECVKVCEYLRRFGAYPKKYARDIFANETMVKGIHKANKLINSCSLCGLCEAVCPNDFAMQDLCLQTRQSMVCRDKMPASAHEFAIQDMLFSNSEKVALALHEPGTQKSTYLFFPGCQLGAIYPEHVVDAYAHLRRTVEGGVGLMLRCCGAPALWAGKDDLFQENVRELEESWKKLGSPTIIVACPTCYKVMKEHFPAAECRTLWDILVFEGPPKSLSLAIHDPCTARYEPAMQEAVRRLLKQLGCRIEELALGRDRTECCGFGGLMSAANPSLAKDVAGTRGLRSRTDYVTYCAMCRSALAATGKRILHVFDLLYDNSTDPAGQKAIGYSDRRENRYRLKNRLLKELWMEKERSMTEYEMIVLHISEDILERMEERRILREDVQKVIDHAEKSGNRLFNPEMGHWLASFKPAHVTYWVEYSREGDGFRIHNAYSHRMEIIGGKGS